MIEFRNVAKSYHRSSDQQQILALEGINLNIAQGEFVSLVGPSGAGKTTLVKMLTAEELPNQGEILIIDRDITKLTYRELPYYRRKVGVVWQDFKLLLHKTVWENVAFALEVSDIPTEEILRRVPKILSLVGLGDRGSSYPHELSGGERQRTAIARAMVNIPKILIADEPTGNLDPVTTTEIINLLQRINQGGTTVILATHNKNVVDGLHKRVIALEHGRIISDKKISKYIISQEVNAPGASQ